MKLSLGGVGIGSPRQVADSVIDPPGQIALELYPSYLRQGCPPWALSICRSLSYSIWEGWEVLSKGYQARSASGRSSYPWFQAQLFCNCIWGFLYPFWSPIQVLVNYNLPSLPEQNKNLIFRVPGSCNPKIHFSKFWSCSMDLHFHYSNNIQWTVLWFSCRY